MFQKDLEVPEHKPTAVDCASQLIFAGLLSPQSCFDSTSEPSSSSMRSCPTEISKTNHMRECRQGWRVCCSDPKEETLTAKSLE